MSISEPIVWVALPKNFTPCQIDKSHLDIEFHVLHILLYLLGSSVSFSVLNSSTLLRLQHLQYIEYLERLMCSTFLMNLNLNSLGGINYKGEESQVTTWILKYIFPMLYSKHRCTRLWNTGSGEGSAPSILFSASMKTRVWGERKWKNMYAISQWHSKSVEEDTQISKLVYNFKILV